MTRSLPVNPSLEQLKKQAKSFLKRCEAADADTLSRVLESHPKYASSTIEDLASAKLNLSDCQLILAREYGFATWTELKEAVASAQTSDDSTSPTVTTELVEKFLVAALLTYQDDYRTDIRLANELIRSQPAIAEADIWCAAAVGNTAAVERFLDADPKLVDQQGGPHASTPLLCLCYSRAYNPEADYDPLATATLLLDRGADPNAHYFTHGTYRFTCVTGAIGEGEGGVVRCPPHPLAMPLATLLLERGANPNDSQGMYNSMFSGGTHWIQLLLDHGLNREHLINWDEKDGHKTLDYLLAHACKKNKLDRVELLLKHGADPDAKDWYDKLPIYQIALQHGNSKVVALLIEHGATRLEPKSEKQRFYNACMAVDKETVDEIRTAQRASKVESWIASSKTHLMLAADADRIDAVRFMIGLGFPVGDALFDAAWHGRLEIAKLLVEYGASARTRHRDHHVTPVAYADRAGHPEVVDYLMEHDIDVFDAIRFDRPDRLATILADDPEALERPLGKYCRRSDRRKQTPLVYAVLWGKTEAVQLLLKNGADSTQRHERKTLATVAKENGFEEVAAMLT